MKIFQRVIIILIFLAVLAVLYGLELKDKYVVPIVMYHSVSADKDPRDIQFNSISKKNFEYQMAFLKTRHYSVISLDELVLAIKGKRKLPFKTVVLTFDDGYTDNYENAFPVLRQHGFPATMFVAPGLIGKKGYLTWDQVKEMDASGISFGSHTLTHAYLPELSQEKQRREIYASKKILEHHLRHPVNNFCYKIGGFTDWAKAQVKKAGYLSACTTNRGFSRFNRDVYELKRVRLNDKDNTSFLLWVKLSGYYNFFRKAKNPN